MRPSGLVAGALALACGVTAARSAHAAEPCRFLERSEVVGLSADAQTYALRTVKSIDGEELAEVESCGYPPVAGKRHNGVELALCRVGKTCEQRWTIYAEPEEGRVPCTGKQQAKQRLDEAKAALAEAGVDLDRKPIPLAALTVPRERVIPIGVNRPVRLTYGESGRRCVIGATADDFGSAELEFIKNKPCWWLDFHDASIAPGHGVVFYHLRNTVHCRATTGTLSTGRIVAALLNARGLTAHRKKDYAASARDFEQAYKLDPTFGQAAFNLACAHARSGDQESALAALEQALGVDRETFAKKAKKDKDLDALRADARFQALLR